MSPSAVQQYFHGGEDGDYSHPFFDERISDGCCAYCGRVEKTTLDHVPPRMFLDAAAKPCAAATGTEAGCSCRQCNSEYHARWVVPRTCL